VRSSLFLAALCTAPAPVLAQTAPAPRPPPPKPAAVGEVVVTGQAPALQTSIDRRSYSVAGDLQAATGSIGDALRNVPSLEVDVQGNVSLRGDPNVTVLIDGKPSGLFRGESRGQALQQLPAERIERVEVITNPSAEFRADGTAGIINLITRKAKGAGRTGSARVMGATGGRAFVNGALGYNGGKLSVAADAFARLDVQDFAEHPRRLQTDPGTGAAIRTVQDTDGHNDVRLAGGRISVDYDLDPDTRLSGELSGQLFDLGADLVAHVDRIDAGGATVLAFDRGVRIDQSRQNVEVSSTLLRKFAGDGHQLTLSSSYEDTNFDRTRSGVTLGQIPVAAPAHERQVVFVDYQQVQLKGDYVRPDVADGRLKAGFDVQWDDNTYDNRGFRGPSAPAALPDAQLTNLFKFRQRIAQGYVTWERPFGDLTVLAGLRLEDVRIDLDQVTQGTKDENDYTGAYPSLHLSWKLSDTQALSASYAERVQRPDPDDFNAFRFIIDPLTFRSGNPRLQSQETQSFELGWQRRENGQVLLATAYFRINDKVITEITRELGGGAVLLTRDNVSETRAGGLELVASGRLGKAITYNVSGNLYWSELDAAAVGLPGKRSTVTASGRANVNWQVTPNDFVQVSGFLNARRLTAQGYVVSTGMLNLGYRHKFNDQLSAIVTVQDALKTFRFREVVNAPGLQTRFSRETDSRYVAVGLSWTFGGGRSRDNGFDFNSGGGAPPQ
jgi:outer membrane receptor protein involved in Fe transport